MTRLVAVILLISAAHGWRAVARVVQTPHNGNVLPPAHYTNQTLQDVRLSGNRTPANEGGTRWRSIVTIIGRCRRSWR